MAWIAPAIGAVASVAGDLMSQSGQQATNAAMLQQNADIMNWETQMSDTAMQRRVTDLKAAGLNPMLAVQEGGASVPSAGPVPLQNPSGSFAGLGGQINSAMSQAQIAAQIANTEADTKSKEIDNIRKDPRQAFSGGALGASAPISPAQVEYAKSVSDAQSADRRRAQLELENQELAYKIDNILPAQATAAQMDAQTKTQLLPYTVSAARSQAMLLSDQVPGADAQAAMMRGPFGKYVPYLDEVAKSVGIASGFMGLVRQFMPK